MINVSIILPVYNGENWLVECLQSVLNQETQLAIQLSVYEDSSNDKSLLILQEWSQRLKQKGIDVVLTRGSNGPYGVGFAKNRAIERSSGEFLCFLDADDVMHKDRIQQQYEMAKNHQDAIIGSQFWREPEGSTERYTKWANSISHAQLMQQIYTSHGPTVIMPTWFMSRKQFNKVGMFDESGKGTPEDLIFFYKHLESGGRIYRIDQPLLMYRFHPTATTFSIHEDTIWEVRIEALQKNVLKKLNSFTIWNAGKQGRHFYRSLSDENKKKVLMFCDVDVKKITKGFYTYEDTKERPKPKIQIKHFSEAVPPIMICVKQDLTGGVFEDNLNSLNLQEGTDYFYFS